MQYNKFDDLSQPSEPFWVTVLQIDVFSWVDIMYQVTVQDCRIMRIEGNLTLGSVIPTTHFTDEDQTDFLYNSSFSCGL